MRWLLFLAACGRDPASGTAVGNPGNLGVALADVPADVVVDEAEVAAETLVLDRCGGSPEVVGVDATLDALAPAPIEIPGGSWCAATLLLAGVGLRGETDGGTRFEIALDIPALQGVGAFAVDGDDLLFGLSLAGLDAGALEDRGVDVVIASDDPLAAALGAEAPGGLWRDDGDGRIGPGDEEIRVAGTGPDAAYSAESSGCAVAGSAPAPWALGWVLLLYRGGVELRRGRAVRALVRTRPARSG
jgi:hypothetical protein